MHRSSTFVIALVLAAAATPPTPAVAKGLVGLGVCGAEGCVDRGAVSQGRDAEAMLGGGVTVADPGRAPFVRLKLHIGDPVTHQAFGVETLVYLPREGLYRASDGSWHQPDPPAAALFKRAARGVPRFPATALKPFEPPRIHIPETVTPPARHPAVAGDDGAPAGLLLGAAGAVLAAAALVLVGRRRRGRPATG